MLEEDVVHARRKSPMKQKVVIFGATEMAKLMHFYLTHDSPNEVVAFTVTRDYLKEEVFDGLPVVPFEDIESIYPSDDCKMFVALFFGRLNKKRAEMYSRAKAKGYELISYISSKAVTWPGLVIGDNSFVGEGSVINPFAEIGNNVIIAGSFVGHNSKIKDHCFLASHAVVLGDTTVEPYCFLGANSTIRDGIVIGKECIIGAGATITKNTKERSVYIEKTADLLPETGNALNVCLTWPVK
jgi:sugar O-acyltransferase (sialic acid O-acetyltransferase NeuD family)